MKQNRCIPCCLFSILLTALTIIVLSTACSLAPVSSFIELTATASPLKTQTPSGNPLQEILVDTATIESVLSCTSIQDVLFPQGSTSFITAADIPASNTHCFTFNAAAGQLLMVTATSQDENMVVEVYASGESAPIPSQISQPSYWVGILPASQQYQVALTNRSSGSYYFLTLELPANIILLSGQNRYEIAGTITVNRAFHPNVFTRVRYRVYMKAGDTLDVELLSPDPEDLSLGIYGEQDGQPYKRFEIKGSSSILNSPLSQFYFIDVYGISGSDSPFTLQLTLSD